jgi:subtilisin family serine protease
MVVVVAALAVALTGLGASPPVGAQAPPEGFTSSPLTAPQVIHGAKSNSGRAAKTDPALLRIDSAKAVSVMVKLDYDSLAAYKGDVAGLPATSPAVTGQALNTGSAAARRYTSYVQGIESRFTGALRSRVPSATTGKPNRVVYGGIPVSLPGNQIAKLLNMPGVAAVQSDAPEQIQTDSSPEFIGANPVYAQLGGAANAGRGVIVGVLDTGAWPEHPSYTDPGNLPAPPPTTNGTPRICDFGDNPLTPAIDVFVCNNKLIGGAPFIDTYNALLGGEVFPDSARDSNGHGTHTSTTAAGGMVADANPLGISRGPIHGIAPGAAISMYKVCGLQGCFPSDSAQAVARAIIDRVDVINFSIGGGEDPFSDVVELAFLDAYAAGVFVSTSAGNEGPGPATVGHLSPWVSTVAASTQRRAFTSTVTLNGSGGATASLTGASITAGIASPLPVVLSSAPPYSNPLCLAPAPPGLFTGKIVACQRGPGRIAKGFNVFQGGAAGMLLYNTEQAETLTDNHFLPTVHLEKPEGDALLAFLAANPGTTASFTQGVASVGTGDAVTGFSSRGPGSDWLKPDIAAPGAQILAGNTPVPDDVAGGPPGNFYQAIAGTSMASPHVAGAAALLAAVHPDWTPGQIRSALTTTATTAMVKPDLTTPADPFDRGAGRVTVDKASNAGLTLDESAANFAAASVAPLSNIDLNIGTINAPVMPGEITTTRVVRNVTTQPLTYQTSATSAPGSTITVKPGSFSLQPNKTQTLTITIAGAGLAPGQYFGQVNLDNVNAGGTRDQHLTVAFKRAQGDVTLDQTCAPTTIARQTGRSVCTVTIQNNSLGTAHVDANSKLDNRLRTDGATGATVSGNHDVDASADLAGFDAGTPTVAPGASPGGFIPLSLFGVAPIPVGDEDILNFTVPAYVYGGAGHNRLGVTSNGYLVVDGGTSQDVLFIPQVFPDPARPNNVLAPFWTDLDGTGAAGIRATVLTDGVNSWIVVEWSVNVFGTASERHFQVWLGIDGTQDISYTYDPAALPADPNGQPFNVGAENSVGNHGSQIAGLPTQDLRVTSTAPTPGGILTYSFGVRGAQAGTSNVTTSVTSPIVKGTIKEVDAITVT